MTCTVNSTIAFFEDVFLCSDYVRTYTKQVLHVRDSESETCVQCNFDCDSDNLHALLHNFACASKISNCTSEDMCNIDCF